MQQADLQNKTILITGASSGIGAQTACELAERGANLILSARRLSHLEGLKIKCEQLGAGSVWVFPLDIANALHIDGLVHFVAQQNLPIDVLINNAGFGYGGPFVEMDFEQAEEMFRVNVLGLMYLTQKVAVQMLDQGHGHIINVASLAGKVPTADYAIYAATKAAVIAFSHSLRMELRNQEVAVTVVNFGPVATPFFDQITGARTEKTLQAFYTLDTKEAATTIVRTIGKNKREINRPLILNMGAKIYQLAPNLSEKILLKYFE